MTFAKSLVLFRLARFKVATRLGNAGEKLEAITTATGLSLKYRSA